MSGETVWSMSASFGLTNQFSTRAPFLTDPKRWSDFLGQPAEVDSPIPSIRQK